ncbi:MAG: ADP-forming succinate--CoA ligase subunit beta [Bacillota bacterium]|nr:ADP-forming succinate--CoA ligase subunit beta [Bacillota bacterium]
MKLFEYAGKELFSRHGIPVPRGKVVSNAWDAVMVSSGLNQVVLKAQVLSGKRGKAGGIKFASSPREVELFAGQLLGLELNGNKVEKILVEEKLEIQQEIYLAITVDGSLRRPVILASSQGGMDIEEVPEERIIKWPVNLSTGIFPSVGREIGRLLGLQGKAITQFADIVTKLFRVFAESDAELVEINPLFLCDKGFVAGDAKVTVDDDAYFRQKEYPRVTEGSPLEERARSIGLSYVELGGDIAIMANGAGITMATLDTIQFYGGSPANFLDAGGGANVEQTSKALEILLAANPKVIFINIFGGITRCDDVANAFVQVKKMQEITVPVVLRMSGTNEELGLKILAKNGITAYRNMQEAAIKAVELSRGGECNGNLCCS